MKDALLKLLRSDKRSYGWSLHSAEQKQRQFYGIASRMDTEREVQNQDLRAVVYTRVDGTQGSAQTIISPLMPLSEQIDRLVGQASLQKNSQFDLPQPAPIRSIKLYDSRLETADLAKIADQVVELANNNGVQLSGQEWFVSLTRHHLATSTGVDYKYQSSSVLAEIVLYQGEEERQVTPHYRRLKDIDLEKLIKGSAQMVKDLPQAIKPQSSPSQRVAVVAEEFVGGALGGGLMEPILFHAGGMAAYRQLSRFKLGHPVAERAKQPITMKSDPGFAFGTSSYPIDAMGLVPTPTTFIKNGIFRTVVADSKYAQYLGQPTTGVFGVVIVDPGNETRFDLLKDCLLVEAFSALDVDEITGDFFGEIRLGYQYDQQGNPRPIKRGGVSGNLFKALSDCQLSQETVFTGTYQGPELVVFNDLAVSG